MENEYEGYFPIPNTFNKERLNNWMQLLLKKGNINWRIVWCDSDLEKRHLIIKDGMDFLLSEFEESQLHVIDHIHLSNYSITLRIELGSTLSKTKDFNYIEVSIKNEIIKYYWCIATQGRYYPKNKKEKSKSSIKRKLINFVKHFKYGK